MMECWDEVNGPHNIIRANKSKSQSIEIGRKAESMEPLFLPSRCVGCVVLKPANPEERKSLRLASLILNDGVEDAKDTSIQKRVVRAAGWRQQHNVWMCAWIDRVLCSSDVVCCVVKPHDFVLINPILDNTERGAVAVCKPVLAICGFREQDTGK